MLCVRNKYTGCIVPDFSIQLPIYLYTTIAIIHGNSQKCCIVDNVMQRLYILHMTMYHSSFLHICFHYAIMENIYLEGVLCYHPYLVFLHFTVLLSLYILLSCISCTPVLTNMHYPCRSWKKLLKCYQVSVQEHSLITCQI